MFDSEGTSIEYAASRAHADLARLLRPDGQPLYGEQERAERRESIMETFRSQITTTLATVDAAVAASEQDVRALSAFQPIDALSTDDLARAAALSSFVAADFATLPLSAVLQRIHYVAEAGDPVNQVLASRHGAERLAKERQHQEQHRRPTVEGEMPEPTQYDLEVAELAQTLGRLGDQLVPAPLKAKAQRAQATVQAARDIRLKAGRAKLAIQGNPMEAELRATGSYGAY